MIILDKRALLNNVYYVDNHQMFNELVQLVNLSPKAYPSALHGSKKYILDWINNMLPAFMLSNKYTTATKCYWILSGLKDFPVCPTCYKSDNYINKNVKLFVGYRQYCSSRCAQVNQATRDRARETNRLRYGYDYFTQTPEFIEKAIRTNNRIYGKDWACQNKNVINNIENSIFNRFGVRHALQSDECSAKYENTCLMNYGVKNAGGAPEIQKKTHSKYFYDNLSFDSAPELAYYIWLKDNGMEFEYQPDVWFDYEFGGEKRKYFPDFKVDDVYVEIKGDQFLAEDGKWRNPYRDPEWSDERYAAECARYEAKRQCALANGVRIMYEAGYSVYLDFVYEKYGSNYLRGFKNRN